MSRAFIALGKLGDVTSVLPIIQHEYERTGEPQKLVISREYAPMLSRAKFVDRVVYNGDFSDLAGAIRMAKDRFDEVVVPQVYGKDFPMQHRTPSFQLDQWDRAGYLSKWDTLALTLNRPHYGDALVKKYLGDGRIILFADYGQSSPFPHKEELALLLTKDFGAMHKIVRLSEIRLKNPMDALSLYDAAELLVTVDTLHLHLSAASKINVIAIVTDTPTRWHGTAYQKRFAYSCRYGEFQLRKGELMAAARRVIEKRPALAIQPVPTHYPNGYNLSAIRWGGKLLKTYRYHPENSGRTLMAMDDGERTSTIQIPVEAQYSQEDGRLFVFGGKLWMSYTVSRWPQQPNCVIAYGELVQDSDGWKVLQSIQPKYDNNDFSGMVKNLVFFERDEKLFCIWGCKGGKQIVLQLDGDKVVAEHKSPEPTWGYGEIRGGAVTQHEGRLLRLFHSRTEPTTKWHDWRYSIGVATMEATPPFRTLSVSPHPLVSGNEKYNPDCKHWKANVAIPYGCVENGRTFLVAAGFNDCECGLIEVPKERLIA